MATVSPRAAARKAWATEMIDAYYEVYGPDLEQWRGITPWLDKRDIVSLANSMGADDLWTNEDRELFLENEGADWTIEELNTLIDLRPLLDDDSKLWESFLPGISFEDRKALLDELDIPNKQEIEEMKRKARTPF